LSEDDADYLLLYYKDGLYFDLFSAVIILLFMPLQPFIRLRRFATVYRRLSSRFSAPHVSMRHEPLRHEPLVALPFHCCRFPYTAVRHARERV